MQTVDRQQMPRLENDRHYADVNAMTPARLSNAKRPRGGRTPNVNNERDGIFFEIQIVREIVFYFVGLKHSEGPIRNVATLLLILIFTCWSCVDSTLLVWTMQLIRVRVPIVLIRTFNMKIVASNIFNFKIVLLEMVISWNIFWNAQSTLNFEN